MKTFTWRMNATLGAESKEVILEASGMMKWFG
jgi:hypothetical protein